MTTRPYKQFKEKWLGKRIDYDKAYWYQCVDLIKQYADECLWMWKIWAIGNAKNIPDSSVFRKFFRLSVKSLIQWDIIIRTRWNYWHIAIVDHILWNKVYVLEQNWSWKNSWSWLWDNAIRVKDYSINWFDTVLRNEKIVQNFKFEFDAVNEKISEHEWNLKNTKDYLNSICYWNYSCN